MGSINTFRKQLDWLPVSISDGYSEFKDKILGNLVEQFLNGRFKNIKVKSDCFKANFSNDLYFSIFIMEFDENLCLRTTQLDHLHRRLLECLHRRFDAFNILYIQ